MRFAKYLSAFGTVAALFPLLALGSPIANGDVEERGESTLRYTPGNVTGITKTMISDQRGAFNLGSDGVLRSFTADLIVLDYRQLDPSQVEALAKSHLAQWEASPYDAPPELRKLAEHPVDGRLVTDIDALLNPKEKPNIPQSEEEKRATGVSLKQRGIDDILNLPPLVCIPFTRCFSILECLPEGCNACYYPNGPPFGVCYIDIF